MHKIQIGKNWSDLKTLLQILVALVGFLNGERDLQKSLNCMHSLMTYEQWLLLLLLLLLATSLTNPFFILSIRYSGRSSFIFFEWVIQVVKPVHNWDLSTWPGSANVTLFKILTYKSTFFSSYLRYLISNTVRLLHKIEI